MRRFHAIAGVGILGGCLAGWAALALGQPAVAPAPPSIPLMAPPGTAMAKPGPTPTLPPPPSSLGSDPAEPPVPMPVIPTPVSPGVETPVPSPSVPPATPTIPTAPAFAPAAGKPEHSTPPALSPVPHEVTQPRQSLPNDERIEATATPENPGGKQEPAVSIEWVGPPAAKVGQPADYSVVVRNVASCAAHKVLVRVELPTGLQAVATEPKAEVEGNVLTWDMGTMSAREEKNLQMKLTADGKGDLLPKAWVTFTGVSAMKIKVREPKLVLKAAADKDKIMVGDAAQFSLTVSNPGDGSADRVVLHTVLSDGLEHVRGNKFDCEIGNLAPGESRSVQVICGTRAGGVQKCECSADADCGLKANDVATVPVIIPRLDMQITGPGLKYLERKALYTLKVTNPGDAAATNVTVSDVVPNGFKVMAASDGGRHDFSTRTVSWFLGSIEPGQTRQVQLEVQAINLGEFTHKASAIGARGLHAESNCSTRVEGLAALMIEMVDTEDPIEVNGETAYEIRITNTGSKTETEIKLVCTVPEKMEFKNAQGPVHYRQEGRVVVFEPIERLAPKADALFRINVKALEAGTVRFKSEVTSSNLTEPNVKMEPTSIYDDTPRNSTTPRQTDPPATLPPSAPSIPGLSTPVPPPSLSAPR